nr:hypothetical protein BaRGS_015099 [Batillaria attramentaria]
MSSLPFLTGRCKQVILGGGRRYFQSTNTRDPETGALDNRRRDGRDLTQEWLEEKRQRNMTAQYVWNASSFYDVDVNNTDYLLGEEDQSLGTDNLPYTTLLYANGPGYAINVDGNTGREDISHVDVDVDDKDDDNDDDGDGDDDDDDDDDEDDDDDDDDDDLLLRKSL